MSEKVRLNFSISKALHGRIEDICDGSGRHFSDVVRQVVAEFMDHERAISIQEDSLEIRTNVVIPEHMATYLDRASIGLSVSKSQIVSGLLSSFVGSEENVRSDIRPTGCLGVLRKLMTAAMLSQHGHGEDFLEIALEEARQFIEEHKRGCK